MASTYFTRTPASGGNRRTFTFSTWIKRSDISGRFQLLFMGNSYSGSNLNSGIFFNPSNQLATTVTNNGTNASYLLSTQLFRDVSAWYHIVIAYDTTQATDTNRVKMYVNGSQITALDAATYPTQNLDTAYNQISIPQVIGYRHSEAADYYTDGLLANTILIDGQQLTPSSFGQTDATTGIWKPKSYSGSYGTNGFFLKFENSGSLGTDSSGNGNNFTVNGTPTQILDTPSNVFATINPLNIATGGGQTFSNGNTVVSMGAIDAATPSTFGVKSGKWYWEVKWTADGGFDRIGIIPEDGNVAQAPQVTGIAWNRLSTTNGMYMFDTVVSGSWGSAFSVGDVINFALDCDNTALYIGQNGTWRNSGVPTSGASRTGAVNYSANSLNGKYLFPAFGKGNVGTSTWQTNFGNGVFGTTAISSPYSDGAGLGKFQYQPPTGYYALCTKNINVYG
jgi:hypothetical protein